MYNDWFTIGNFTIHGYGFMIALGILVGFWIAERQAKKNGLNPSEVDNIVYVALISGWLFSKITYTIINWKDFIQDPIHFLLTGSGWVVIGGILGGAFGAYLYCRYKKLNFMEYANLIFPEVALAQAFGRIGCFFAGCCYGKHTTSPFGIVFPANGYTEAGARLIPTQLLSAFGDFVLFIVLFNLYNDKKTRKYVIAAYMILYSIGRFLIEFLRGDRERGFIGMLSTSQFLCIFTLLGGLILMFQARKKEVSIL
ncbi:MAG: prolipoprotein diacylglyceryl transferase [Solobacterium sp.]|nr:prolipoprotein diacylglyceryl transferase [Solobacterium sp.]